MAFFCCNNILLQCNIFENNIFLQVCKSSGGKCETIIDGYYVETVICAAIGFAWFLWGKKKIRHIQSLDDFAWKITKRIR